MAVLWAETLEVNKFKALGMIGEIKVHLKEQKKLNRLILMLGGTE
jgi:hypothetical protein